ncbi:hypothetical protein Bbelb_424550 [Branchiostoma belcheri]|nr:hypothetical protein Bbelb_424550 [Branchiostoma belcheri]
MSQLWLFVCVLLGHSVWKYGVSAVRNDAFPCWNFNTTFVDCSELDLESVPLLPQETTALDFSDNRIHKLANNSFHGLDNLLQLKLCTNGITSMEEEAFANLQQLEELNLKENPLVHIRPEVLLPLQSLRKLDLSTTRLRAIPEALRMLPNLQDINLGRNDITSASLDIFRGMSKIQTISLQGNYIKNISASDFSILQNKSLHALSLSATVESLSHIQKGALNALKTVQELDLSDIEVQELLEIDLSQNGFQGIKKEAFWHLKKLDTLKLAGNYLASLHPSMFHLKNLPLIDYKPDCKSYIGYYMCIIMSTLIFLYTTLTYVIVKYHAYIRYLYQYARGKLRGYQAIPYRNRYEYDVFVSYNSDDIRWVQQELIPNLEEAEPHYRLCIGDRDFLAGRDITTNIVEAIQGSRKTLCLLTRRFVRSGWCTLEFKIAQHRLFEEGQDVLVLVLLEDIPAHVVQRYNRLRQLMSRKTYLVWLRTNKHGHCSGFDSGKH